MSSHFLYNFRPKDRWTQRQGTRTGQDRPGQDQAKQGAKSALARGFLALAFYGHKNFIINFNNLGKHIAGSEKNRDSGTGTGTSTGSVSVSEHYPKFSQPCPAQPCPPLYITWHIRTPGISGSICWHF
ncbi:GL19948 [Drosophila persimilis]|uniref:GL19948 n=1 Tax=Drosophila persimilis TaxID=7234 RepID=B4GYL4_DROPE|nr:GL19948 [Drosophila persimilis]